MTQIPMLRPKGLIPVALCKQMLVVVFTKQPFQEGATPLCFQGSQAAFECLTKTIASVASGPHRSTQALRGYTARLAWSSLSTYGPNKTLHMEGDRVLSPRALPHPARPPFVVFKAAQPTSQPFG